MSCLNFNENSFDLWMNSYTTLKWAKFCEAHILLSSVVNFEKENSIMWNIASREFQIPYFNFNFNNKLLLAGFTVLGSKSQLSYITVKTYTNLHCFVSISFCWAFHLLTAFSSSIVIAPSSITRHTCLFSGSRSQLK